MSRSSKDAMVITSTNELDKCVTNWMKAREVAVDMEADSMFSYYEKICLIQVTSDNDDYLIDPLIIDDMKPFRRLAESGKVIKIFHDADFDLRSFDRDYSLHFVRLFDTKVAAELCGEEHVSLAALLEKYFKIKLSKRYQKYNWGKRPLDRNAITYAVRDTKYLTELKRILKNRLREMGRMHWARQEFAHLETIRWQPSRNSELGMWRLKGSRRLPPPNRSVLNAIWKWRENEAEISDFPPFKIMNPNVLVRIAKNIPKSEDELLDIKGFPKRYKNAASKILKTLHKAYRIPEKKCPKPPKNGPKWISPEIQDRMGRLKKLRIRRGEEYGIQPAVLAGNDELLAVAKLGESLKGKDSRTVYRATGMRPWQWVLLRKAC